MDKYNLTHTGAVIDHQIDRVLDGSVVVENTLSALDETSNKPVSGKGIAEAINKSEEKTNVPFIYEGYGYSSMGQRIESKGEKCTDIIPVAGGTEIIATLTYPNANIFFYDANKKFLFSLSGVHSEDHLVVPEGAYYIAATDYIINTNTLLRISNIYSSILALEKTTQEILPLRNFTKITNSLDNGDFSDGNRRWSSVGGTAQFVDNVCSITNNSGVTTMSIRHADKINGFVEGHKYFVFAQVEADSNVSIRFYVGNLFTELYQLVADEKTFLSYVVEPTANQELGFYVNNMEEITTVKWSYIGLVDITNIHDISLAECLHFTPNKWFSGTIALTDLLSLKNNRFVNEKKKYIVAASDSINKNIADYICDGKNDEEEINAAISSLPTNGGTIELLNGTYTLNLPIYPKEKTRLVGQGENTILKIADGIKRTLTSTAAVGYNNFAVDSIEGLHVGMDIAIFSDLHIGYNNGESKIITSINPLTNTVTVNSAFTNSYTVEQNAYIVSAYNAIDCYDVSNVVVENLTIDGNRANNFEGNYDEWQNGVYLKRSNNCVVRNCIIKDCMQVGVCSGHINNEGSQNCLITNNLISGCRYNAIHVHGMSESVISENIVSHGTQSVIYTIDTHNVEIANNVILEGERDGILILSSKCINVIGNTIKNVTRNGITISSTDSYGDCENIHVCGAIINNAESGIKVGSIHSVISNCSVSDVAEYGIVSANSQFCQIVNNNVSRLSNTGIMEYVGSHNLIVGNSIDKTTYGWGIRSESTGCLITSNLVNAKIGGNPILVTGSGSISENNLLVE